MTYSILYHTLCIFVLVLTYLGSRDKGHLPAGSLRTVYVCATCLVLSDATYYILEHVGYTSSFLLYIVNIIYFVAGIVAVYAWMRYSFKTLDNIFYNSKFYSVALAIPAAAIVILTLTTPITGFVFTIENGLYVRGSLFMLDTAIKLFYVLFSSIVSFAHAKTEPRKYMRKRFVLLGVYCIPILLSGVLQSIFGLDANCVASAVGLAIVYKFGLANETKTNEALFKAISQNYFVSFAIDIDDHSVMVISQKADYHLQPNVQKPLYEDYVRAGMLTQVAPDDRIWTEQNFAIDNVLKHLETNNTYSIIFKTVGEVSGYNKATFMKAFDDDDRHGLFLGIENVETRQLLIQNKENLDREKEQFERVKEYFTSLIAGVIEARDNTSGEHVMRVKDYAHILCNYVMEEFPEYGLTPLKSRYIVSGSALHDIGKIMIPDAILLKEGRLTPEELAIMKSHCEKGVMLLGKLPSDVDADYTKYAMEICHWHHERYDGSGYPDGLVGDAIPISAQIAAVSDCFDALTSLRSYKDPIPPEEALQMLFDGKCGELNKKLLICLKKAYEAGEII